MYVFQMTGSTDSLDSGKDSALDDQSPQHEGSQTCRVTQPVPDDRLQRRRRRHCGDLLHTSSSPSSSSSSPPPVAAREHHNRSKSADCGGGDDSRKTHAKSLSAGDDSSFDHKIRLWRKRADSQGSIDRPKPMPAVRHQHSAAALAATADIKGPGGAPDLVMDLPVRAGGTVVAGCAVQGEIAGGGAASATQEPDSPDMGTAAERFAKQNQCTLKKYSKPLQQANGGKPELPPKCTKPPLKAKPQIFKKPAFLSSPSGTVNATDAVSHP